jgi:molecular chaperone HtpG
MAIIIPKRFNEILSLDNKLYAATLSTVANISELLESGDMYFFEEYTDHGVKHIQNVLQSCQDIIEENTIDNLMKPLDVAVLINAVMLHDIGMFISLDIFNDLLAGKYDDVRIDAFDEKKWSSLWIEFLDEARKFNGTQKIQIFGDEMVIVRVPNLSNKNNLDTLDRKLIGEFIRRNHPRFAHEISLTGYIKGKISDITFASDFPGYCKDLSGLIARSHGIDIRDTFEYLKSNHSEYEWANPYSIKIIFLMIVIRVADYFQFDINRISIQTLKIKTFSTPYSEFEHLKHLAIKFVKVFQNDNETLMVETEPKDSVMFLSLKNLFKDIQKEIDTSWAILGEIYGKDLEPNKPKIKYRRIKSNIDNNRSSFLKKLNYIPEEITFTTDIELLKLLAAPLYGNNPSFGIRELLQNSIDACRERLKGQDTYQPNIDVFVVKDQDEYFFSIIDNGKGMTLFEIKHYFLRAGSSFRKSLDWKKKFTDESGHSLIARSGKFGIGVLASFILGSEIHVKTGSISSDEVLEFKASINSNQIEVIKRDEKSFKGTTIKVRISKKTFEGLINLEDKNDLKWYEWYTLSEPPINYYVVRDKNIQKLTPSFELEPSYNDISNEYWNIIYPNGFHSVRWTYSAPIKGISRNLSCNGIVIPYGKLPETSHYAFLKTVPRVSVFDFDGILNLNLNRNSLEENEALSISLLEDIYSEVIAKLLCYDFKKDLSILKKGKIGFKRYPFGHPCLKSYYSGNLEIGFTKQGFFLFENHFIKYLNNKSVIEIVLFNESKELGELSDKITVIEISNSENVTTLTYEIDPAHHRAFRIFLREEHYDKMFKSNIKSRIRQGLKSQHKLDLDNYNNWKSYTYQLNSKTGVDIKMYANVLENIKLIKEYKYHYQYDYDSILSKVIAEYFKGDVIIPFDMKERKSKYPYAFEKLERHIRKYQEI